ncbi:MAG TPA: DUF445 domain-containing protein [Terriglobales bacterium]|nr:DUF445 domain-containing protein [Terriglobales bacterium]
MTEPPAAAPRRNHVGTVSLLLALLGSAASRIALATGPYAGAEWLHIVAAGFEAALVGGLADWFAVTALFRHPLGLPIPHTAIIPKRRGKIIEQIVAMVEEEWLSPDVIGSRLQRITPSEMVLDWLSQPEHVHRLGDPLRDLLQKVASMLSEPEVVEFADRTLQRQLREVPLDASAGEWLARVARGESGQTAFRTMALSLVNVVRRPATAEELELWIERAAWQLREVGQRLVPLVLRRRVVQRKLVEAICEYATTELQAAADEPDHPLRRFLFDAVESLGDRLAAGDPQAIARLEEVRRALIESLEASSLIADLLRQLQAQLQQDLASPDSALSQLVDRQLRQSIVELLDDADRRARFDLWVRNTAQDLLRRHHHHIGMTVRESLEALDTSALVHQIEARVGADLQFIRLNGAVVGGLIGVVIAVAHRYASW